MGCYSSPPPTQDLVPRSKAGETTQDTRNGTETIFMLPGGLFLIMMGPLHLHELDCLITRLALRSLENTNRML